MVNASARREQVAYVQSQGISQRRACQLLCVARSTLSYQPQKPVRDEALLQEIRHLVEKHPRYGYRRVWALLKRAGQEVNPKRVYRLWREHGLSLRRRKRQRRRGPQLERPPLAKRVNEVWAYDFAYDRCAHGQKLKGLVVVDEYTREALAIEIDQRIRASRVIEVMKRLIVQRGAPQYLRSDNGPEFVAKAVQAWLAQSQIGPVHIDPGKPWQNGVAESFIGKLRDECLNLEWFYSPAEAQVVVELYRRHYNRERPHSSLGYATPEELKRLTQLKAAKERENAESLTLTSAR